MRRLSEMLVVLLFASFLGSDVSHAASGDAGYDAFEDGTTWHLSNEELPLGIRMSTFAGHLEKLARQRPSAASSYLASFGMAITRDQAVAYSVLWDDYEGKMSELHRQALGELAGDQAAVTAFSRALILEYAEHAGETLGRWLALLRSEGLDTDAFLRRLLTSPGAGGSMGGTGDPPKAGELESRGRIFERAFRSAYGRGLVEVGGQGRGGGA